MLIAPINHSSPFKCCVTFGNVHHLHIGPGNSNTTDNNVDNLWQRVERVSHLYRGHLKEIGWCVAACTVLSRWKTCVVKAGNGNIYWRIRPCSLRSYLWAKRACYQVLSFWNSYWYSSGRVYRQSEITLIVILWSFHLLWWPACNQNHINAQLSKFLCQVCQQ